MGEGKGGEGRGREGKPHLAVDDDPAVLGDVVLSDLLELKHLVAGHSRTLRPGPKFPSERVSALQPRNRGIEAVEAEAVGC